MNRISTPHPALSPVRAAPANEAERVLASQFLTPARLMWVLDIGESTEAAWREAKMISFFRQGRVVRYEPAAVLEFVTRSTVRARGQKQRAEIGKAEISLDWARIERLISDQIKSREQKVESKNSELQKAA